MKTIEARNGKIKVSTEDRSYFINVKNKRLERQKSALGKAKAYLAENPRSILNLLGGQTEEELDLNSNPDFVSMVNALRYASVSKRSFLKAIRPVVDNSPNSPEENISKLLVNNYTDYVFSEIERLGIEARTRR